MLSKCSRARRTKIETSRQTGVKFTNKRLNKQRLAFLELLSEPKTTNVIRLYSKEKFSNTNTKTSLTYFPSFFYESKHKRIIFKVCSPLLTITFLVIKVNI